jgi:hypothetical protein
MRKFKTIHILTVVIYLCLSLFPALPYQHCNFAKADLPSLNKILQNDSFQEAVFSNRKSDSKAFTLVIPQITRPLRINLTKKLYHSAFPATPVNTETFVLRC